MECIFLNAAGQTLFTRTDMESGHWVQQEMSVNADFPFDPGKVIEIGQRIAFRDPATDIIEVFEIRNVVNTEPDHYQQITAEHIAVSELSDEHINTTEITNKTAAQALATALTGTLWSVGTNTASGTQSADISRGSVWNAVSTIQQNWNVYITPRVVISAAGAITNRYLDIAPAEGTFRGVRLSIRKNMLDPVVTYDDTDVLTALYGYGGNVDVTASGQDDKTEELTFKSQVWTATSAHPAKPAGQTYLEWPEKTLIYGRNGRPRFGYYQNGAIKDAAILLQKTWEALQRTADPKISIAGTCVDLYRLGYKDQPLRLHDIAIVEIEETGEVFQKEIIMLDVDLVDPTGSRPEIGDYIPNIIYINREANEKASGGGGGGGGRGQSNKEKEESETWTAFEKTNERIGMVVGTRNGGYYIKAGQIALEINKTGKDGSYESSAYIDADHVNISASQDVHTLAGSIVRDTDGKLKIVDAGGLYVQRTEDGVTSMFGVWDNGNLTGGVMARKINGQTETKISGDVININGSSIKISAERIDIDGVVTALGSKDISCGTLKVEGYADMDGIDCDGLNAYTNITAGGNIEADGALSTYGRTVNVVDASVANDVLTITKADGTTITFSKAAFYEAGWTAAIDEITLPAAGALATFDVYLPPSAVDGAAVQHQFALSNKNNNTVQCITAGRVVAELAHGKYDAGWAAAVGKVSLPAAGTAATFSVDVPPSTVDGNAVSHSFAVSSKNNNTVQVIRAGTVVSEFAHNKYNAGWAAAVGKVTLPGAGSSSTFSVKVPPSTVDGAAYTHSFALSSKNANTVQVIRAGTVVAEYMHGEYSAGYDDGWNACIDACTKVDRYTRSASGGGGPYGGNNYVHYINYQGSYKNIDNGWWKTTLDSACYHIPSKKT